MTAKQKLEAEEAEKIDSPEYAEDMENMKLLVDFLDLNRAFGELQIILLVHIP